MAFALAACASPPAIPASPPPEPPSVAPAASAEPRASVLVVDPVALDPEPEAAPPEPVAGRFVPVDLPRVSALEAIGGAGPKDLWMVGADREVIHWDGARAARTASPRCVSRTQWMDAGGRWHPETADTDYHAIAAWRGEVLLQGSHIKGQIPIQVTARSRDGAAWECAMVGGLGTRRWVIGGALFEIEANASGFFLVDGRRLPSPMGQNELDMLLAARTDRDLWLADYSRVWHWNGVAHEPRSPRMARVIDLWVDETGAAWVLGRARAPEDPRQPASDRADALARWDPAAGRFRRVAVPRGFEATIIRGTSARDVWMFGSEAWFHWDGERVRRAPPALDGVGGVWSEIGGELWVAGSRLDRSARDPKKARAGAAVRVLPEVRP
jgi:hypothetical protein